MGRSRPCLRRPRGQTRGEVHARGAPCAAAEERGNPLRVEAIGDLLGRHSHRRHLGDARSRLLHGGHGASGAAPAPAPQSQQRHRCESTEQRERRCPSDAGSVPRRLLVPIGGHDGRAAGCHGVPRSVGDAECEPVGPRGDGASVEHQAGPTARRTWHRKGRVALRHALRRGSSVDQKTYVAHADGVGHRELHRSRCLRDVRAPQRSGDSLHLGRRGIRDSHARVGHGDPGGHIARAPVPGRLRVARTSRRSPADDHEREAPAVRDRHGMARHPLVGDGRAGPRRRARADTGARSVVPAPGLIAQTDVIRQAARVRAAQPEPGPRHGDDRGARRCTEHLLGGRAGRVGSRQRLRAVAHDQPSPSGSSRRRALLVGGEIPRRAPRRPGVVHAARGSGARQDVVRAAPCGAGAHADDGSEEQDCRGPWPMASHRRFLPGPPFVGTPRSVCRLRPDTSRASSRAGLSGCNTELAASRRGFGGTPGVSDPEAVRRGSGTAARPLEEREWQRTPSPPAARTG